jgi:hypothetical protein
MANRKFEMYEIRQMIQRLRLGESNRAVARAQQVGRDTVARVREIAAAQNWLETTSPLPDDATIARYYQTAGAGAVKNASHLSTVEPFREKVLDWHRQGIAVSSIRQALARQYGYGGSVHAVYGVLVAMEQGTRIGFCHVCGVFARASIR